MNIVKNWFGKNFDLLHPELQRLHLTGGSLSGALKVQVGSGIAGFLGKRLAQKLGIPLAQKDASIYVAIRSTDKSLLWSRSFNNGCVFISHFKPHGHWPDGYWLERTGSIQMALQIKIRDQGWYWQPIKTWICGIRVPLALLPRTTAYKRFDKDRYHFYVSFVLPLFGLLLSYEGQLKLAPSNDYSD